MHVMQIGKSVRGAKPTALQSVPSGHSRYCWYPEAPDNCGDVPAGSGGSHSALCCLTQKQMFSVSEALATPTAVKGQDSNRKGPKAKLREIFLQNCQILSNFPASEVSY